MEVHDGEEAALSSTIEQGVVASQPLFVILAGCGLHGIPGKRHPEDIQAPLDRAVQVGVELFFEGVLGVVKGRKRRELAPAPGVDPAQEHAPAIGIDDECSLGREQSWIERGDLAGGEEVVLDRRLLGGARTEEQECGKWSEHDGAV